MSEFGLVDLMFLSATLATWLAMAFMIKFLTGRGDDSKLAKLAEENKQLRKQLREEVERVRQHYELLLKDAAIKNAMMVGLWNAFRSGRLSKCYEEGGKVRVLADGTVICENGEDSYVIRTEFKEPEVRMTPPEEVKVEEGEEE